MYCRSLAWALLVLAVFLPWPVFANDTSVGGFGSDLVPLTSTKVRMKAEDILIRPVGKDWKEGKHWEVEADYTFENLTDEPVKLQVGFPEYACEGGDPGEDTQCDPEPLHLESMRTTVDGQPVVHRKGTIKKGHPWRPRLGQVWLYDVTFAPGRDTTIAHRYRVRQGEVSDGTALGHYVTRTGATWAGTIGHARFRIHVPVETRSLSVEPAPNRRQQTVAATGLTLTTHVVEVDGKKTGEILLEARDWEPKTDLHFSYFAQPGALMMAAYDLIESEAHKALPVTQRCPSILAMWQVGLARAEPNPGDDIAPSDPTEEDVERFVREGLGNADLCRGFVYAMYGKRFEDDAHNRYFYGPGGWKPKGWPYGAMQPNPGYGDALLTPGDRATLQLIDRVEARLNGEPAVAAEVADAPTPTAAQAASPEPEPATAPAAGGCGCRALDGRTPTRATAPLGLALGLVLVGFALRARTRRTRSRRPPAR